MWHVMELKKAYGIVHVALLAVVAAMMPLFIAKVLSFMIELLTCSCSSLNMMKSAYFIDILVLFFSLNRILLTLILLINS